MGLFDSILGPGFLGLSGESKEQESTQTLDPTTKAINQLRLSQAQSLYGTLGGAIGEYSQTGQLGQGTNEYLQRAYQATQQPGFDTSQWYNQTLQGLDPSSARNNVYANYGNNQQQLSNLYQQGLNQLGGTYAQTQGNVRQYGNEVQDILNNLYGQGRGDIQSFYSGAGQGLANQQAAGSQSLSGYGSSIDALIQNSLSPALVGAGGSYYRDILGPQVGSEYALMGLGRSGGRQEAEGKAASSIALPIAQQLAALRSGNASQIAGLQAGLTSQGLGLQAGLYGQEGGALSGLGQQFAGLQGANLSQVGSNLQGLNQGYLQDIYGLGQQYNSQQAGNLSQQAGALTGLDTNYLNQLYGLNQAVPGVSVQAQQQFLQQLQAGLGYSDYARLQQQQTAQGTLQGYLSALNSTPYTPSMNTTGSSEGNEGLLNTAFGQGVGQGVGSAASKSDRTDKEAIEEFDSRDFLDNLNAYIFEYKDKEVDGKGKHIGIMAQELENTELGKRFVVEVAGSKYIDYQRMSGLLLGCIVDMNTRLRRLENG